MAIKKSVFGARSTVAQAHTEGYQTRVKNDKGYHDLIVNLNANGKAIRIQDKFGDSRVNVTVGQLDTLIAALKHVKATNVKTSTELLEFDAA